MTTASLALRPIIRNVMKMAHERQWSEAALLSQVRLLIPDAGAIDVKDALVWNLGQQYVASGRNEEMEVDVWTLTEKGKATK